MLRKTLFALIMAFFASSVAVAQVDDDEDQPRGQAGTPTYHFIGDRYRIGVGLDSEFDIIGELEAALHESDRSAFILDGWLGDRRAAGIKLNYHWLIKAEAEEGPDGPVYVDGSVAKLFVAADQNQLRDRKLTFGGGWEGQRWAFAGYGMTALTSERLVDSTTSIEERLVTGQIDGHDFSRVDNMETIIEWFEEPYDWGLGLRGERYFNNPLVRLRGGLDYEKGDYSSSQTTASLSLDKHFQNTPHSLSFRTSYARKSGDFVEDRGDLRGTVVYSYSFGGGANSWRASPQFQEIEVEVPGESRLEERVIVNEVTMTGLTTFDFDSSALRSEAEGALDEVMAVIEDGGLVGDIQIVGHTCDIGTEEYNQGLSERRARTVVDYLTSQGIDASRIHWEGHGELDPRYPNDSEENRARNRRVEISFVSERESTETITVGADEPAPEIRRVDVPVEAPWIRRALRNPVRHKRIVDYSRYQKSTTSVTEGEMQIHNEVPVANDDTYTVEANSVDNVFDVLANDTDPDGDVLTLIAVSSPSHGQAEISGSQIAYTPDAGFVGTDSFTYTVEDGFGGEASATVTVTVESDSSNQPPVAEDIDVSTGFNQPVDIDVLASASDPDGDELSIASYSQPGNGTVSQSGNVLRYEPETDFSGVDVFTYTVEDEHGAQATASVRVTVSEEDDNGGPTPGGDLEAVPDYYSTAPGETSITVHPMENDSGESIEIVALHQWYGPPADFEINSDGSVTFDLSLDCDGRHHFNYTIEDVHGDQDSANITVVRVNDASTEAALAESGIECPLS